MIYEAARTPKEREEITSLPAGLFTSPADTGGHTAEQWPGAHGKCLSCLGPPSTLRHCPPVGWNQLDRRWGPSHLLYDREPVTSLSGPLPFPGPQFTPLCHRGE